MLLEVRDIVKRFYGVTVLHNVSLEFQPGQVHAIVGENGAGKSTLMKIIGGIYHADSGEILIDSNPVKIPNSLVATQHGISIVHQEYNLVNNLTVLDNIMLGKEVTNKFGKIDFEASRKYVEDLAKNDKISIDVDKYAGDLSSAEAKVAEILRACSNEMKLLVLDEPTASLDERDTSGLFSLIQNLKGRNVGVIYISHRLDEIFEICDVVSVLKDGKLVGTWKTEDISRDFLVKSMVGREITDIFPPHSNRKPTKDSPLIQIHGLGDGEHFRDINTSVQQGEILGIGGMSGHGQREFLRALFGIQPIKSGFITLEGKKITIKHPADALKAGIAFLSDDRRNEGLAQMQSVQRNIAYPSLHRVHPKGIVNKKRQQELVQTQIKNLNIRLASANQRVQTLSGGNQQRVVLAKWLPLSPKVMLLDEPTLGVDVGAKVEIYRILRELADHGMTILMVTSDMLELLNMSDRIVVFSEGALVAEFIGSEATEEQIMMAASGGLA
jgi:ribose transport system ATP-binding protein